MLVLIIDGTKWRGKGYYSQKLDVAFVSSKVPAQERWSLIERLKQSPSNTIWR